MTTIVPGGDRTGAAWMVTAGWSAVLGDRTTLNLAWRYTDLGEVSTDRVEGRVVWRDGSREPLLLALPSGNPPRRRPCAAQRVCGRLKSAPVRMPEGHREVTVFMRVKKRTPSGPCMWWSPNRERFQPPKLW